MHLGTKQLISLKYYGKWEGCTKTTFFEYFGLHDKHLNTDDLIKTVSCF